MEFGEVSLSSGVYALLDSSISQSNLAKLKIKKKREWKFFYSFGITLDFAVIAIILTIETPSIIMAIVPNSGTTCISSASPIGPANGSSTPNPRNSTLTSWQHKMVK